MKMIEAQEAVGQLVMSRDAGFKAIPSVTTPHGPYRLLRITKGGMCQLERRARYGPSAVSARLLDLAEDQNQEAASWATE